MFSSKGTIYNAEKHERIKVVSPKDLFEFACDEKNTNIIPPNINFWMQFAGSRPIYGKNGIMIDTNTTEDERYMLENKVIAAWGNPKMYIESFQKGDYALFYKKGKGIIAVGEIITKNPETIDNGLQHRVKMIVDYKADKDGNPIAVSAKKIKALLNKGFYFASTRKVPFLSNEETKKIIDELV